MLISRFQMALALAVFFTSFSGWAQDPCDYLLDSRLFNAKKHGMLLATYMNWAPDGNAEGKRADRDDDRIGVCRIFSDGAIVTAFGCAGRDETVHEAISKESTYNRLVVLISRYFDLGNGKEAAFAEKIIENSDTRVYASNGDGAVAGDGTWSVDHKATIELVHQLCPLDNEPAHRALVHRGEPIGVPVPWCAKGSIDCPSGWVCTSQRVPLEILGLDISAPNDPGWGWAGPVCGKGGEDDDTCPRYCMQAPQK